MITQQYTIEDVLQSITDMEDYKDPLKVLTREDLVAEHDLRLNVIVDNKSVIEFTIILGDEYFLESDDLEVSVVLTEIENKKDRRKELFLFMKKNAFIRYLNKPDDCHLRYEMALVVSEYLHYLYHDEEDQENILHDVIGFDFNHDIPDDANDYIYQTKLATYLLKGGVHETGYTIRCIATDIIGLDSSIQGLDRDIEVTKHLVIKLDLLNQRKRLLERYSKKCDPILGHNVEFIISGTENYTDRCLNG